MRLIDKIKLFFEKDIKPHHTYYCLDIFDLVPHSCCNESHIEEGLFEKTGRQKRHIGTNDMLVEVIPTLKYYKENKLELLKKIDSLKAEISKLGGK